MAMSQHGLPIQLCPDGRKALHIRLRHAEPDPTTFPIHQQSSSVFKRGTVRI